MRVRASTREYDTLVSVVMNAYFSEEFVAAAIESVLLQTYTNWEIVLWETFSKDGTSAIASAFGDQRIRYFRNPRRTSLYESRMNAVAVANGELIAFLDCDDTWMPRKLEKQIGVFEDAKCVMSCTDYLLKDETGPRGVSEPIIHLRRTYSRPIEKPEDVLRNYRVGMSSLMIRRDTLSRAIPDPPPEYFMIEDIDIVIRSLGEGRLVPLDQPLMTYRWHGSNYTAQEDPFKGEWDTWLSHVDSLSFSNRSRSKLTVCAVSMRNWAYFRARILVGDRKTALKILALTPSRRTQVKMWLALVMPTWVALKVARLT